MKQVAQRPRDGAITVVDVPRPAPQAGWVLIANRFSLISAGTERSKISLGQKNLVQKARARPDLVRKVVDRARVEGAGAALSVARDRLNALAPLGYSSAGIVLEVGRGVEGLAPGDRVACGGAGWANHAEIVAVPRNLVARVPTDVELWDAAYATVGAIALHAVRQSEASLGERVGVIGLGLVGQLALRVLRAAGCFAIGIDPDERAVAVATAAGFDAFCRDLPTLEPIVARETQGAGLDAVLVTAAAASSDPVELAARLARDRGRIVIVGDVLVAADRALLYDKELEVRLSRSYGPGRYDLEYEQRGRDLPIGYVRWTEQRNLQAFIDLLAAGRIAPSELTTHRFSVARAQEAYAVLTEPAAERAFGVLLEYEEQLTPEPRRPFVGRGIAADTRIGLIGAGSFARSKLLPALRKEGGTLVAVTTASGLTATDVASRFGFERTAGSAAEIIEADDIDAVVIATRHGQHAALAAQALRAGKAVFVEKPLALTREELSEVKAALDDSSILMVGFNRRFAPLAQQLMKELHGAPGLTLLARVNAGPLPVGHWLHDLDDGGGRLIGEGCHFVDLLAHLAGSPIRTVYAAALPQPDRPLECSDSVVATFGFDGAAVGTFLYSGDGDLRLPKERIEAFGGGTAIVLDDFRRLEVYREGQRHVVKRAVDKGIGAELARFLAAITGRIEAPSAASYLDSTMATLALLESLRTGEAISLL